MKNEEIQNIKKILGLQHNKDYTDIASLRYGKLMIMTDQVSFGDERVRRMFADKSCRITMVRISRVLS